VNRRRPLLLSALLVAALAASLALRERSEIPPTDAATDLANRGWWTLAAADADPRADEEVARQLSLPYAAGVERATSGRYGVRAWDRERAQPGWNLYVSGHAREAILISLDGRALWRWKVGFEEAFPNRRPTADSGFFRRARLLPNGDLLALVQGTGLVRLDRDSRPIWSTDVPAYNDFWVSPEDGHILTLAKTAIERPDLRAGEPLLEDSLVELDAGGRVLRRASLLSAFERSPLADRMFPLGPTADAFHSNAIVVLGGAGTTPSGPFAPGNLLVSFREIDTVAVLDPSAESVLWARRGPYEGQHEPSLLPDGRILLFDNHGGPDGTSRVLAIDPAGGAPEVVWAGFDGHPLRSAQAGAVHRLGNGDLLVVESERGDAFELDAERQIVWEFRSPHRAGARRELVAALFDVVRIERTTPFLDELSAPQSP